MGWRMVYFEARKTQCIETHHPPGLSRPTLELTVLWNALRLVPSVG